MSKICKPIFDRGAWSQNYLVVIFLPQDRCVLRTFLFIIFNLVNVSNARRKNLRVNLVMLQAEMCYTPFSIYFCFCFSFLEPSICTWGKPEICILKPDCRQDQATAGHNAQQELSIIFWGRYWIYFFELNLNQTFINMSLVKFYC